MEENLRVITIDYDFEQNLILFFEFCNDEIVKQDCCFASDVEYDALLLQKFEQFLGNKDAKPNNKLGLSQNIVKHIKEVSAFDYYIKNNNIEFVTSNPFTMSDFNTTYSSQNMLEVAQDSFLQYLENFPTLNNEDTLELEF